MKQSHFELVDTSNYLKQKFFQTSSSGFRTTREIERSPEVSNIKAELKKTHFNLGFAKNESS